MNLSDNEACEMVTSDIYGELVEEYGPVVTLGEFQDRLAHGEDATNIFRGRR